MGCSTERLGRCAGNGECRDKKVCISGEGEAYNSVSDGGVGERVGGAGGKRRGRLGCCVGNRGVGTRGRVREGPGTRSRVNYGRVSEGAGGAGGTGGGLGHCTWKQGALVQHRVSDLTTSFSDKAGAAQGATLSGGRGIDTVDGRLYPSHCFKPHAGQWRCRCLQPFPSVPVA